MQNLPLISAVPTNIQGLFAGVGFTTRFEGWTEEESKPLLDYLFEQAALPRHVYRHEWQENDLVIWDNSQVSCATRLP